MPVFAGIQEVKTGKRRDMISSSKMSENDSPETKALLTEANRTPNPKHAS